MNTDFAWPAAGRLKNKEWLFPGLCALIIVVAGTAPYAFGYLNCPEGKRFMGFVGRGTVGANAYLMLAKQAQDGFHLMENRDTPEPLPRTYFHPEWWIFGKVARWSGLSLIAVFHLGRVLTVIAFCFALYFFLAVCLPTLFERRVAFILIAFGAGFGWILWLLNQGAGLDLLPSRDLKGVSVFSYLCNKPHFMRATLFALLKYAFFLRGIRSGRYRDFLISGLCALAHSAIRPFHIPELYLIYLAFPLLLSWRQGAWNRKAIRGGLLAGAVHLPAVCFYGWLVIAKPLGVSGGWQRNAPPYLIEYILWLGLPMLLFVLLLPWHLRLQKKKGVEIFLVTWLIGAWLVSNGYPYWREGHEGAFQALQVVPPVLAVLLLFRIAFRRFGRRFSTFSPVSRHHLRILLAFSLILLALPSTLISYGRFFTQLRTPDAHTPDCYYLPESTCYAFDWLDKNSPDNIVVLASHMTSQFIPRLTQKKPVTGHEMLTVDHPQKNTWITRFYGEEGDQAFKKELVDRFKIRYVIHGPLERSLGLMRPESIPWLKAVFTAGDTTVYAVAQ